MNFHRLIIRILLTELLKLMNQSTMNQKQEYDAMFQELLVSFAKMDKSRNRSNKLSVMPSKKMDYVKMVDLTDLELIVKKGDLVVLDIDKTILNIGSKKYVDDVFSLCPSLKSIITNWLCSEINVIILTARKEKHILITEKQLESINMSDIPVIYSPNVNHNSTKGIKLSDYLTSLTNHPNRIVIVDDMLKNHYNIKMNVSLPLIHVLKINGKMFECNYLKDTINSKSGIEFPKTIFNLHYLETIHGGTGGVHVYCNVNYIKLKKFKFDKVVFEKEYVLKTSYNINHVKEEILANALYHALGVQVPNFAIYDHLPYNFPNKTHSACACILSEYIKSSSNPDYSTFKDNFVADCLLSNWDICVGNFKNVICNESGIIYRIDNGGSLRYRALGELKITDDEWSPIIVTELETMKQYYKGLTENDIKNQIKKIF